MKKKAKALVLMSGGLDSLLSAALLKSQGLDVTGLCFESIFFNSKKAEKAAVGIGIKLKVADLGEEILDIVKSPPSGRGKNMNPCIDCHGLMFRKAGEIAKNEGFDVIATGEVLGQRPFSQNSRALNRVKKLAGVEILRPLSAKLLNETAVEKQGLVDRAGLMDISGRKRENQFRLAKELGVKEYPSPAGGCILTEPDFSRRLKEMIERWPDCTIQDARLLKRGRVYWLCMDKEDFLFMVGRHEEDNERLEVLAKKGDFMVKLINEDGPTGLLRSRVPVNGKSTIYADIPTSLKGQKLAEVVNNKDLVETACRLVGYHKTTARGSRREFSLTHLL